MIKRKPMEIPPAAFSGRYAGVSLHRRRHQRDEIAARQLHSLREHLPRDRKLRLSDVKELFERMRDLTEMGTTE